jgi:hypothetical protein
MKRLLGMLGSLLVYLSVGTVIAAAIIVGYAATHGYLDKEKLAKMADVARGIEPAAAPAAALATKQAEAPEQPSFDDIERIRGIKARNLELREQAVKSEFDRIEFEKKLITKKYDQYERLKDNFDEKFLNNKKNETVKEGREKIRLIWENMKPRQVKDEILKMLDDPSETNEAVTILSSVAASKQAKIIAEFKTDDEVKKLDEILRMIRQGVPEVLPIDRAREELKQFDPKNQ